MLERLLHIGFLDATSMPLLLCLNTMQSGALTVSVVCGFATTADETTRLSYAIARKEDPHTTHSWVRTSRVCKYVHRLLSI